MRARVMVVALCGALAVGCASDGAPAPEMTTTPDSTETTASAGVSPTPSPSASAEAPPEVDLTAEDGDYRRVVEEILRFREWLFAHPHRQDLVSVIYNEDCPCHDGLVERLQAYVDAGQRVEGTSKVESLELLEADTRSFRVRVAWSVEGQVVNNRGAVVDEGVGPVTEEIWFFVRDPAGTYRVAVQRNA